MEASIGAVFRACQVRVGGEFAIKRRLGSEIGHILEEMREPMAREIKTRAEDEATAHLRDA